MDLKKRHSIKQIKEEHFNLNSSNIFKEAFYNVSPSIILNETGQILYSSHDFVKMFDLKSTKDTIGYRTGEILSCIHSKESKYGCGTSKSCSSCNILKTIIKSKKTNSKITNTSNLTSNKNNETKLWDLSVTSLPIYHEQQNYYILSMSDISSAKQKRKFERLFLHDLINSLSGLSGLTNLIISKNNFKKETANIICQTSKNLLQQVTCYKNIMSAQSGELFLNISEFEILDFLKECIVIVTYNKELKTKITIDSKIENRKIRSNKTLLSRIIINMLKNAMEAENEDNSEIIVGANETNGNIVLWVKNNSVMSHEIQKQIFQNSFFSTKGSNRGLGTYSMKLLGEKYLKGKVGFVSNEKDRTTFFIELPLK